MDEANRKLARSLDQLYKTLARYPQPKSLIASPLHMDVDKILRDLTSYPLREIPRDMLFPYAFHAVTTMGYADDFKHFLPRILEVEAVEHGLTRASWIATKVAMCNWRNWPDDQQEAVQAVFLNAFEAQLLSPMGETDPWEWLEAVDRLEIPLGHDLIALLNAPSRSVVGHWAMLVSLNTEELLSKRDFKRPNLSPKTHQLVLERLFSKDLIDQMFDTAVNEEENENHRFFLDQAFDTLSSLQAH